MTPLLTLHDLLFVPQHNLKRQKWTNFNRSKWSRGEEKAKRLRDQKEEELEETGLMENEENASKKTRIKDPVNRHKILTPSN